MHTETGELRSYAEIEAMEEAERRKYIPVARDLTLVEKLEQSIALYSPCACGSNRKFKFCCWANRHKPEVQLTEAEKYENKHPS
jgi:uncharacterized protein YecA (UPF0149 family)